MSMPFTEIVTSVPEGDKISIPMADMFRASELYYTKKEYALHIERILSLCKTYKSYSFSRVGRGGLPVMIWGKEDVGTLLARSDEPSTVFVFSEQNMIAAFWTYLVRQKKNSDK